jgi:hypothetical protein
MPSSTTLRGSWLAAIAVALISLRLFPALAPASPEAVPPLPGATPQGDATNEESPSPGPCLEGRRVLEEYAAVYAAPGDAGARAARTRFEHAIALIPDPEVTAHTDYFDAVLEGIEEAVSRGGDGGVSYVRDRSWLPWPGADPAKRSPRCWEKQPGVVVYRPTADPASHPAFVVYLVGETPTWGLQRASFEAALALADEFSEPGQGGTRRYRVLGPTFSGTAPSLAAVLRRRLAATRSTSAGGVTFDISSGTATNPDVGELLGRTGAPQGDVCGSSAVTYWSATPDDKDLLRTMLAYLAARGGDADGPPCRIVILSESLTAYGSAIGTRSSGIGTSGSVCWNGVKFPPNLKAIREAYEVAAVAADGGAPRAPLTSSRGLGDTSEFSAQTPAVHDLDLGEVLRELSEKRVRYVGLLATDARDVAFMAGRIRDQVPDIQLFTLGSDIRYLHPTYAPAMNGMLVAHASTVRPGDTWSTALEDEMVRNVFFAGRYLLTGSQVRGDVVISLIGNGALWQIGPDGPDGPARTEGPALPGASGAPMSWRFVFILSMLVLGVILSLVIAPAIARYPAVASWLAGTSSVGFVRHRGRLWSLVGSCKHSDLAACDRLVTASLLSVAACPPLLMLIATFAHEGAVLAVLGLFFIAAASWLVCCRKWSRWRSADMTTRLVAVATTLAAILALGTACGPQREATFNLLSGGSPVVAALIGLAIFLLGVWCWRVRLRFLDSHRFGPSITTWDLFSETTPPIAQALGDEDRKSKTGLFEIERSVLRVIANPWKNFTGLLLSVHLLLAASILGPLYLKRPITFEPGWRNWFLVIFACLALLPITGNLSRLLATWIVLGRLLRRLAACPGMAALQRLPPRLARPIELQLALSGNEITDLAHSLAALRPLSTLGPELAARYDECRLLLEAEMRYDAGAGEQEGAATRRADLVDKMLETSSELSRSASDHSPQVRALIDDYVASLVAVFLPRYVRHFRLFIPPLIGGSVLSALMTSLYIWQPQRLITSIIFVWVGGIVLAAFVVYVALDRDPVISAMGKREPDVVTWNWSLLQRVVAWGVFPLGSLLAAQYPEFAFWVSSVFRSLTKGFQ